MARTRLHDRTEAGRMLSDALIAFRESDVVVLGVTRGGVPVAVEVAYALGAPLDVVVVRAIGVPGRPETAMGAVSEQSVVELDDEIICSAGADPCAVGAAETRARAEVERQVRVLHDAGRPWSLAGRVAIVVDDGLASQATARAACRVARKRGAACVVIAAPVGSPSAAAALAGYADQVVCPWRPADFTAVGDYYEHFEHPTDHQLRSLLDDVTATVRRHSSRG